MDEMVISRLFETIRISVANQYTSYYILFGNFFKFFLKKQKQNKLLVDVSCLPIQ